jgi:hypothetical protein
MFFQMVGIGAIVDCGSEMVSYAFLYKVFCRFWAPTKVLTNQGTKFREEFQELCESFIPCHGVGTMLFLEELAISVNVHQIFD